MIISEFNKVFQDKRQFQTGLSVKTEYHTELNGLGLKKYIIENTPETKTIREDFEKSASNISFSYVGKSWLRYPNKGSNGSFALGSGRVSHGALTEAATTFNIAANGSISIDYRTSSEGNSDIFYIYLNDEIVAETSGQQTEMTTFHADLEPGFYTLKLVYEKDGSVERGDDRVYIDNIVIEGVGDKPAEKIELYEQNGEWKTQFEVETIQNVNGSKVTINANEPPGTSIHVYGSVDGEHWETLRNGGTWPFPLSENVQMKILLKTENEDVTPVLYSIGLSFWEEVTGARIAGRPTSLNRDVIKVHDLMGRVTAYLENAKRIVTDVVLDGSEILQFEMSNKDKKAKKIMYDQEVIFKNRRYVVTQIGDGMEDTGLTYFQVEAEGAYIQLNYKVFDLEIINETPAEGLERILSGTGWEIGPIEAEEFNLFSISEKSKTALWYVRQWAKVIGLEVYFDTLNKKINFLKRRGSRKGTSFRYRKNLKSIKRKMYPPEATVIEPRGKNGMTIAEINNGITYIENYSWYISQGVTIAEARKRYRKVYILNDERFLLPGHLKRYAEEVAEEKGRPRISYESTVIDLATVTGSKTDQFQLGDDVQVFQSELSINEITRILRLKVYHSEPWKNEVELGFLEKGLGEESERSISDEVEAAQPSLIYGVSGPAKTIGTSPIFPIQTSITNFSSTNVQVGLLAVGVASQQATITFRFMHNGKQIGPVIKQVLLPGDNTISAPFIITQLPSGSARFEVLASMDAGTFKISEDGMQLYMYARNILGGMTEEVPRPSIVDNYDMEPVETMTGTEEIFIQQQQPRPLHPRDSIDNLSIHKTTATESISIELN